MKDIRHPRPLRRLTTAISVNARDSTFSIPITGVHCLVQGGSL
jgi:hypothetical protein